MSFMPVLKKHCSEPHKQTKHYVHSGDGKMWFQLEILFKCYMNQRIPIHCFTINSDL